MHLPHLMTAEHKRTYIHFHYHIVHGLRKHSFPVIGIPCCDFLSSDVDCSGCCCQVFLTVMCRMVAIWRQQQWWWWRQQRCQRQHLTLSFSHKITHRNDTKLNIRIEMKRKTERKKTTTMKHKEKKNSVRTHTHANAYLNLDTSWIAASQFYIFIGGAARLYVQ